MNKCRFAQTEQWIYTKSCIYMLTRICTDCGLDGVAIAKQNNTWQMQSKRKNSNNFTTLHRYRRKIIDRVFNNVWKWTIETWLTYSINSCLRLRNLSTTYRNNNEILLNYFISMFKYCWKFRGRGKNL